MGLRPCNSQTDQRLPDSDSLAFLAHGGDMGARVAALDWSATAAGPIAGWPASLRAAVGLLLRSPVAMVLLWGEAGSMIYNDAYAGFAGPRHPAILGMEVRQAWHEVADFNDHVMRTGLAGGSLVFRDQELTLYRDGRAEQVWMDLYYSPVLGNDQQPAGVLAIVVETTAKVTADRWLKTEAARLRSMFEHAPTFLALLSGPDHVYEFVNPAYQRVVGDRPLVGLPVRTALPEVAGQGFFEIFDRVYRTGIRHSSPAAPAMLSRGPGGGLEQRFVEYVVEPVRDEAGAVRAIMVHGSDVTERVQAEQAVRDSEARYRSFAQAMPNQIWTAKPDGTLGLVQ